MKKFTAILFSVLLVWMPFAPAQTTLALSACPKHVVCKMGCTASCGMAGCCARKPDSNSQPAPAIPAQASNQLLFSFPGLVILTLPENPADSITSSIASPLTATGAPLYARDCARLL